MVFQETLELGMVDSITYFDCVYLIPYENIFLNPNSSRVHVHYCAIVKMKNKHIFEIIKSVSLYYDGCINLFSMLMFWPQL